MQFWVLVLILGAGVLSFLIIVGHQLSLKAGKKADNLLQSVDYKYEDFVNRYISNNIVHHQNFEIDKTELFEKALIVIKPEIEGIIAHINTTDYSDVKLKYNSKYFKNIARIAESLFEKRHKTQSIAISENDEQKLYLAFQDAVEADLTQRLLNLKAGDF